MPVPLITDTTIVTAAGWWNPLSTLANTNEANIAAETTARGTAVTAEASTRATADTTINNRLNSTIASGGISDLPSWKTSTDTAVANNTSGISSLNTAMANKQPLDADLTTIAGLTATTDSFLQAKAGAWTTRSIAQVQSDLGIGTANALMAWGRRTTPSATSSANGSVVGVERILGIALLAGHTYTIRATGVHLDSTVSSDAFQVDIRYTTNNTTPTTASPVMPDSILYGRVFTANSSETRSIEAEYMPVGNETLGVLLCVQRLAGTGACRLYAGGNDCLNLKIFHGGAAVTATGVAV